MNREEYNTLIKTINIHMNHYYNEDESEISDYEYDQLMLQLKAAEKNTRNGSHRIRHRKRLVELQRGKPVLR